MGVTVIESGGSIRSKQCYKLFWRISLYVTDDAIEALCDEKFSQVEGNGG